MRYALSDPHGGYDLFRKLLNEIDFGETDEMIVLGDVIDKGRESVRLLRYVLSQPNITLLIGNHEYDFLKYYHGVMSRLEDGFDADDALGEIRAYFGEEGASLDWEDLDRLEICPLWLEGEDYLCVHAGVKLTASGEIVHPSRTEAEILVYDRELKGQNVIPTGSKCVLFGHTPTRYLTGRDEILLYLREGVTAPRSIKDCAKIHLDCGSYLSGRLGCLRLEDCALFYVSE